MVNVVTAGRFKGEKIKTDGERVFIPLGRECLVITPEIVNHIRMIILAQNRRFLSGFIRGLFGKWLGNSAWLSAIQSAQSNSQYRIRISYRDGTASVCIVDNRVLDQLAVSFDFL